MSEYNGEMSLWRLNFGEDEAAMTIDDGIDEEEEWKQEKVDNKRGREESTRGRKDRWSEGGTSCVLYSGVVVVVVE